MPEEASKKSQEEEIQQVEQDQAPAEKSPEELLKEQQEAELQDLCGEKAKKLWMEAQAIADPTERRNKEIAAESLSHARRADLKKLAADDVVRIVKPSWISHMPIPRRKQDVLGRIWSFQANGKDCRLSIASLAAAVKTERRAAQHDLADLVKDQYLTKIVNGPRIPSTYLLDVPRCMEAAIANGWKPLERSAAKSDGKETAQQDGEQHKQ